MPKFSLGQVVATPGALAALQEAQESLWPYIKRHAAGDWGEVGAADKKENELSIKEGFRIMSVYRVPGGGKIWIITEADRSYTTVLTPEDY